MLASGGLVVAVGWLPATAQAVAGQGAEGRAAKAALVPNQFVSVGTDNLVTIVCKHHEMGEGNTTGLATPVADELDADWSLVRTEYAPADAKRYESSGASLDSEALLAHYRELAGQPGTPFARPAAPSRGRDWCRPEKHRHAWILRLRAG